MAADRVRIVLIGASNVGKSALVSALGGSLVSDRGSRPDDSVATLGIDRHQAGLPAEVFDLSPEVLGGRENVEVEICDVGGREGLRSLPGSLGSDLRGVLLCYDMTEPTTFAFAGRWLRCLRASIDARYSSEDAPTISVVLVGTKNDLPSAKPHPDAADFVAGQGLVCRIETSARTGDNVAEAFVSLVSDIVQKYYLYEQRVCPTVPGKQASDLFGDDPLLDVIQVGDLGFEILLGKPKPLSVCLAHGFMHRAVHLWVLDPDRRALLVQRKVAAHRKFPGAWCPATVEVRREHSTDTARVLARAQLGLIVTDPDTDPPRVDERRPPELELVSTVLLTVPLSATMQKVTGGAGPIQEVVDLYIAEVCVASEACSPAEHLRVRLDGGEATEARLVPYADVLAKLVSDPTYLKPSEAYLRALRRGVEKRWTNPLHGPGSNALALVNAEQAS